MAMNSMIAGMRIAGRFMIEYPASSGGMGAVFRALDLQTARPVALKLLHAAALSSQSASRLELEAEVLAKLQHPSIVSYVAHGRTRSGYPFLAMEWLSGEDLAHRLSRQLLSVAECLTLLQRAASALAAAHAMGIIHRDIKPSNLFLVGGRVDQLKLLDFGIAREELTSLSLTRTGSLVGTPSYMAPEQASGAHSVGPSADVFSLGCVLVECLAGESPLNVGGLAERVMRFRTGDRVLLAPLPPEVPEALTALLQRMLARDPAQRPQDGVELLREVELLRALPVDAQTSRLAVPKAPFSRVDQQLLATVLVSGGELKNAAETTLDNEEPARHKTPHDIQSLLGQWGALTAWLPDGSLLVTLSERGSAADLAVQASRIAVRLSRLWPGATVAVATGLGVVIDKSPGGDSLTRVLDFRNAQLASESTPGPGSVWLDELTAGLIEPEFRVRRAGQGLFRLDEQRDGAVEVRSLVGIPTPCVGREGELTALTAMVDGCESESMARAVLVFGRQGMGKSRLAHELLRRLRSARPGYTLLLGRGDPLRTESAGGLLANLLCRLSGVNEQTSAAAAAQLVAAMLQRYLPQRAPREREQLVELLLHKNDWWEPRSAEMSRLFPSAPLEQAFVQILTALATASPLLLVVDDFQWADTASIAALQQLLGELAEHPLLLLALARPEVHSSLPRLWAEHRVHELRLEPLLPAACEKLLHATLGPQRGAQVTPYVLEHARGMALAVEELLLESMNAVDRVPEQLPLTLITLLQGRLLQLPPHAQRALRAASVLGMEFREDEVAALLTAVEPPDAVADGLHVLIGEDLIYRKQPLAAPGATYRFRQVLIQVAAARLLTEAERALRLRTASRAG
jgi:serine/threonine protein kinase